MQTQAEVVSSGTWYKRFAFRLMINLCISVLSIAFTMYLGFRNLSEKQPELTIKMYLSEYMTVVIALALLAIPGAIYFAHRGVQYYKQK